MKSVFAIFSGFDLQGLLIWIYVSSFILIDTPSCCGVSLLDCGMLDTDLLVADTLLTICWVTLVCI